MLERPTFIDHIEEDHVAMKKLLTENSQSAFMTLLMKAEEHFTFEEEEIYPSYPVDDYEDEVMLDRLKREHKEILILLRQLGRENNSGDAAIAGHALMLLEKHNEFELQYFYPKLTSRLGDSEKETLLQKVKNR